MMTGLLAQPLSLDQLTLRKLCTALQADTSAVEASYCWVHQVALFISRTFPQQLPIDNIHSTVSGKVCHVGIVIFMLACAFPLEEERGKGNFLQLYYEKFYLLSASA